MESQINDNKDGLKSNGLRVQQSQREKQRFPTFLIAESNTIWVYRGAYTRWG